MAFKATYVDASTFTVPEDRTGEFVVGRKVLADCGDDGEKVSDVTGSSYDSGANETTVNIYDSVLTSNLSDVWYGAVSPGPDGSTPIHDHSNRDQGGPAVVQEHGNEKHSSTYLTEAPTDGKQYARESGSWAEVQAMQVHDNTWHSEDFATPADIEAEAARVAFKMLPASAYFPEGDILSFSTDPTFKEGSIESFSTDPTFKEGSIKSFTTTTS